MLTNSSENALFRASVCRRPHRTHGAHVHGIVTSPTGAVASWEIRGGKISLTDAASLFASSPPSRAQKRACAEAVYVAIQLELLARLAGAR